MVKLYIVIVVLLVIIVFMVTNRGALTKELRELNSNVILQVAADSVRDKIFTARIDSLSEHLSNIEQSANDLSPQIKTRVQQVREIVKDTMVFDSLISLYEKRDTLRLEVIDSLKEIHNLDLTRIAQQDTLINALNTARAALYSRLEHLNNSSTLDKLFKAGEIGLLLYVAARTSPR